MPYTTLTAGSVITASWANASVRDQVVTPFATAAARDSAITAPVEGMVAYLADSNDICVYNGTVWVAWMSPQYNTVATSQTTTSGSYTDLATVGPTVTATTGTRALVLVSGQLSNSGAGNTNLMGCAVSGATTVAAADSQALKQTGASGIKASQLIYYAGLTSGSNVFTAKYRTSGGTATFIERDMLVLPLP